MRLFLAMSCMTVIGCAATPQATTTPAASAEGAAPPLRFVERAYGDEHSKRAEELMVPFGVNQNGTELILVAMQQADEKGAAFLGDMEVIMTFKWGGTPVECRSKVVFDDDPMLKQQAPEASAGAETMYGTDVEGFKPRLVPFKGEEQELFCGEREQFVARDVARQGWDRTAASERGLKDRPTEGHPLDKVLVGERVHDCEKRPVVRDTQRYDFEVKLGFVPPNWEYLSSRLVDGKQLTQAPPVCYRIEESEIASRPAYRLVTRAFYQGRHRRMATPTATPSRAALEFGDTDTLETRVNQCVQAGGKDPGNIMTPEEWCRRRMLRHERPGRRFSDPSWESND
jgi:hypothetical protein